MAIFDGLPSVETGRQRWVSLLVWQKIAASLCSSQ
jgi:hypothetical protein